MDKCPVMISDQHIISVKDLEDLDKSIKVYVSRFDILSKDFTKFEKISYSNFFDNKILISKSIRRGFPFDLFNKIRKVTPFSEDDWSEYLNLSKKTLQRHRKDSSFLFKPIHTEKIIEIAEVTKFGTEVFDSVEQFYLWLQTPSIALGSLKPFELLKDSYGKELVMSELNRIDQGIFA